MSSLQLCSKRKERTELNVLHASAPFVNEAHGYFPGCLSNAPASRHYGKKKLTGLTLLLTQAVVVVVMDSVVVVAANFSATEQSTVPPSTSRTPNNDWSQKRPQKVSDVTATCGCCGRTSREESHVDEARESTSLPFF